MFRLFFIALVLLTSSVVFADDLSDIYGPMPLIKKVIKKTFEQQISEQEPKKNINISDEKTSFLISDVRDVIEKKLQESMNSEVAISTASVKRIGGEKSFTLDQTEKLKIEDEFNIKSLTADSETKNFKAQLKPINKDYELNIEGRFALSVKLPYAKNSITKGQIITENDVDLKNFPASLVQTSVVSNMKYLIGKSAAKVIQAGHPISYSDVEKQIIVKKNKVIAAIYRLKNLEVKTMVIALQDGAEGEVIKVKNYDSGKLFLARVDGDGNVVAETGSSTADLGLNQNKI